ncbi:MAG TPA: penicillin-binding protein 1C [Candidatus Brocadiia bacterium]|nr:penicillin-binding protein 1C [Candidatus Brocadiia bacterium]
MKIFPASEANGPPSGASFKRRCHLLGEMGNRVLRLRAIVSFVAAIVLVFAAAWAAFPFPRGKLDAALRGGSLLVLDREGGVISWTVDENESWRIPVRLGDISHWLVKATVAIEDERFSSHLGVDPAAVVRAAWQNTTNRRRISGASTITMQTTRLLTPRSRSYAAKVTEAFRATQLERVASKTRIMEIYLNLAPYGGNVVGAEAASRRYFGKMASQLTLGEAALLAGVPQQPTRLNPARHLDAALKRRNRVLERMVEARLATREEVDRARNERVSVITPDHRADASRFADYVTSVCGRGAGIIRTTLDPRLQAATQDILAAKGRELEAMGIDGLATVIIDVERSELAAMFGSLNPNSPITGCVNAAIARRQPGSLLKPFIYAAAFDTGELTPQSVVYDVPGAWSYYHPENFDRTFGGPMPASRALAESRNLPAVRLLERMGTARMAGIADRLGLNIRGAEERCGLSLALGTAEVKLVDITNAYAALSRLGEYRFLRIVADGPVGETRREFSESAAWLVLRCMGAAAEGESPRSAWKTGTSWDRRDAWAIALTPRYAVGVWCGRMAGGGHPALVGAGISLPTAIALAERAHGSAWSSWVRPAGISTRRVCSLSGAPCGSACGETVVGEYIPGVSSEFPCRIHRSILCGNGREVEIVWPKDAAAWMNAGRREAGRSGLESALRIVSPRNGEQYMISPAPCDFSNELCLTAKTGAAVCEVFWFLDGELLAKGPSDRPVKWAMTPGEHELVCSNGLSSTDRIRFSVSDRLCADR